MGTPLNDRQAPSSPLLPLSFSIVQYRHVKYGRAAISKPFGPIRSDSFDSRINLWLIAHRKDSHGADAIDLCDIRTMLSIRPRRILLSAGMNDSRLNHTNVGCFDKLSVQCNTVNALYHFQMHKTWIIMPTYSISFIRQSSSSSSSSSFFNKQLDTCNIVTV